MLCTLRLLEMLPICQHNRVGCYSFASPAIGNASLLKLSEDCGWAQHITNFLLPGMLVFLLLPVYLPESQA